MIELQCLRTGLLIIRYLQQMRSTRVGRQCGFEVMPRYWVAIMNGTNMLDRFVYMYPIII